MSKSPRQIGFFNSAKANRSAGGRLAKQRGQWFEKDIELANAEYRKLGIALVERVHPPVAGPPNAMRIVKAGPLDFMGTLAGGLSIFFDAKTREDPASFAYDSRDQHQIETLVAAKRMGAVAFLLIADSSRDIAYVVSGDALEMLRRGERVTLRDRKGAPQFPVVQKRSPWRQGRPTLWDYLATVEQVCRTTQNSAPEPISPEKLSRKP